MKIVQINDQKLMIFSTLAKISNTMSEQDLFHSFQAYIWQYYNHAVFFIIDIIDQFLDFLSYVYQELKIIKFCTRRELNI